MADNLCHLPTATDRQVRDERSVKNDRVRADVPHVHRSQRSAAAGEGGECKTFKRIVGIAKVKVETISCAWKNSTIGDTGKANINCISKL